MILSLFLLFITIFLSSNKYFLNGEEIEKSLQSLSEAELKATIAARSIIEKNVHQNDNSTTLKSLLCVTFSSLNAESFNNLITNIGSSNEKCDWIVVPYKTKVAMDQAVVLSKDSIKSIIDRVALESNTAVTILSDDDIFSEKYSTANNFQKVSDGNELKPLMFYKLLPHLQSYKKVWLLDEDISIIGFDFDRYFGIWSCAFDTDSPLPCITQPLLIGKELPPFGIRGWKVFNDSIIAVKSAWIEQQAPILDAQFFSWFITYFITPIYNKILDSKTDIGHDFTWCGAAKMWNNIVSDIKFPSKKAKLNPSCAVIMGGNPINHKNFQTIHDWHQNRSTWNNRATALFQTYQSQYPNAYYDGIWDTEFTYPENWYSKSSGTCSLEAGLSNIPSKVLFSKEIYQTFLIQASVISSPSSIPISRPPSTNPSPILTSTPSTNPSPIPISTPTAIPIVRSPPVTYINGGSPPNQVLLPPPVFAPPSDSSDGYYTVGSIDVGSSCLDGDMLLPTPFKGNVSVSSLQIDDLILGTKAGDRRTTTQCKVLAVYPAKPKGITYRGFTRDHLIVSGNDTVSNAGVHGIEKTGPIYTLMTDCDANYNSNGDLFTPISAAFCPQMPWLDYLEVMSTIRKVMAKTGHFWFNLEVYYDNPDDPNYPSFMHALPEMCKETLQCSKYKNCDKFEKTSSQFFRFHLQANQLSIVQKAFPNLGSNDLSLSGTLTSAVLSKSDISHGLNGIIVIVVAVTILLFGFVSFFIWGTMRNQKQKADKESEGLQMSSSINKHSVEMMASTYNNVEEAEVDKN